LDPWEQFVLRHALGETADGRWAAFQVALVVARQNGKGAVLEARELAGLFLLGERLITHSAHQFDTSLEAFRRLLGLIEWAPEFSRRVKRVSRSHGEEGIELHGGQRVRFRTRTKSGGRGFTGDCLIFDEAMILPEVMHGALLPTLSARPNPQVWYTGSAVDRDVHEDGVVLAGLRRRGIRGGDPSLAYIEYSGGSGDPQDDDPAGVTEEIAEDREVWARANPALGIRISEEHVDRELRAMTPRTFVVERLSIGDWPPTENPNQVVSDGDWKAMRDPASVAVAGVCLAFDVAPNRASAAIGLAGRRADGLAHVEVVEHRRGTGWVAERLSELTAEHGAVAVVCDSLGPAASLLTQCSKHGVDVTMTSAREYAQGCEVFFDTLEQQALRHLGTRELSAALKGAATRSLGDAWAWSRKSSGIDISPLVACTLALWGAQNPSLAATRPLDPKDFAITFIET
jgi:hypothetical protein